LQYTSIYLKLIGKAQLLCSANDKNADDKMGGCVGQSPIPVGKNPSQEAGLDM